jgi:hypothetical protein
MLQNGNFSFFNFMNWHKNYLNKFSPGKYWRFIGEHLVIASE